MKELSNKPISAVFTLLKLDSHVVCVCLSHTYIFFTFSSVDKLAASMS